MTYELRLMLAIAQAEASGFHHLASAFIHLLKDYLRK